jgi:hypothetical protein
METDLDVDLKDELKESSEIDSEEIDQLYVDTDLDTYVEIYGNDNVIDQLKDTEFLLDTLEYSFRNYTVENIRYIMDIDNKIRIEFDRISNVIRPEDTQINIYNTEQVSYKVLNPIISKLDKLNKETNKEQLRLLNTELIRDKETPNLKYYNELIATILSTGEYTTLLKEFNNLVLKHENYILKLYDPNLIQEVDFDQHINEAFVGLFGTNKLRSKIKNFALVIDMVNKLECPVNFPNRKLDYCSCILYEYISGITIDKFILNTDLKVFKLIFKQIVYAFMRLI